MSAALFLAWRTTQAASAWLEHGDEWSLWRSEIVRAANIVRGGATAGGASGSGHDLTMAIAMGQQAIMGRLGFAFPAHTEAETLAFVRKTFSQLFGSAFTNVESTTIENAIPRFAPNSTPTRMEIQSRIEAAGVKLARDLIWSLRPSSKVANSVFRFPLQPSDTTKSKLLSRLQRHAKRRTKARKTGSAVTA